MKIGEFFARLFVEIDIVCRRRVARGVFREDDFLVRYIYPSAERAQDDHDEYDQMKAVQEMCDWLNDWLSIDIHM